MPQTAGDKDVDQLKRAGYNFDTLELEARRKKWRLELEIEYGRGGGPLERAQVPVAMLTVRRHRVTLADARARLAPDLALQELWDRMARRVRAQLTMRGRLPPIRYVKLERDEPPPIDAG
jgi:hypothetical protein